jgi:predicted transcriptional regulator
VRSTKHFKTSFRFLKNGGYKYVYKPKPLENLKEMIAQGVEKLVKDTSKTLKEIEEMSNEYYIKALLADF